MKPLDTLVCMVAIFVGLGVPIVGLASVMLALESKVGSAVVQTGALLLAMLTVAKLLEEVVGRGISKSRRKYDELQNVSETAYSRHKRIRSEEARRWQVVYVDGHVYSRPIPDLSKYIDL